MESNFQVRLFGDSGSSAGEGAAARSHPRLHSESTRNQAEPRGLGAGAQAARASLGVGALNLRPEGNAVTAALRKEETPRQEKTHVHPQACYPLLLKETRGRQTHRQHCIKFLSKKQLPAVR